MIKSSAIGGLAVFTAVAGTVVGYIPRAAAATVPAVAAHGSAPAAVRAVILTAR
jgi:hypothetical protein